MLPERNFISLSNVVGFIVIITSVLRALLVSCVIILNVNCLFIQVRDGKCGGGIHHVLTALIYVSNVIYLLTWIPFVMYGLFNGAITYITCSNYCFIQTTVTNSIGNLFLAMLFVHGVEKVRVEVFRARALSNCDSCVAIFIAWLSPTIIWAFFDFTNDEILHFVDDVTPTSHSDNSTVQYKIGFMICKLELSIETLKNHMEMVFYLTLPVCFAICLCVLAVGIHRWKNKSIPYGCHLCTTEIPGFESCRPGCLQMVVIDLVLYSNLAWQAVIRPILLADTLSRVDGNFGSVYFLDVGSHLVLTICAVFAPMDNRKNWFSFRNAPHSVYTISTSNCYFIDDEKFEGNKR